jgi:general secretion pathway protein A
MRIDAGAAHMVVKGFTGLHIDEPADEAVATKPGGSGSYEERYGFRESPFTLTVNPRFVFDSQAYSGTLDTITRALHRHEPLLVITGAPGSGKTLVCRTVMSWRDERTLVAAVLSPPASGHDLLRLLLDQFGVLPLDSRQSAEANYFDLSRTLGNVLGSLGWFGARAVILVDDAHRLPKGVFEVLRSLMNFETDTQKLLQIVLLGEPRLGGVLSDPDFTQLDQRITRRYVLGPLLPEEVAGYIERRLTVAQGEGGAVSAVFSQAALGAIARLSQRVPRVINLLCDRSLEIAHALERSPVSLAIVIEAARSLDLPVPSTLRLKRHRGKLAAAVVLLSVSAAGYWMCRGGLGLDLFRRGLEQAAAQRPAEAEAAAASTDSTNAPSAASMPAGDSAAPATSAPTGATGAPAAATSVGTVSVPATSTVAGAGGAAGASAAGAANAVPPAGIGSSSPTAPSATAANAPSGAANAASSAANAPSSVGKAPSLAAGQPVVKAQDGATRPSSADSTRFLVVAGSFVTEPRARGLSDRVESELGLPVRVRIASGWHQVVVGPYSTRAEADKVREKLKAVEVTEALVAVVPPAVPVSQAAATASSPAEITSKATGAVPVAGGDQSPQPGRSVLERARSLAVAANVRGLLRIRETAEEQLAKEGQNADQVQESLQEIDALLEVARRKRLELDAKALDAPR